MTNSKPKTLNFALLIRANQRNPRLSSNHLSVKTPILICKKRAPKPISLFFDICKRFIRKGLKMHPNFYLKNVKANFNDVLMNVTPFNLRTKASSLRPF